MKSSIKIVLVISILLIVSGVILAIMNDKEEQKTTGEIVQIVNDEYDKLFYPAVEEANEYETEIYTLLLEKYSDENVDKYSDDVKKLKNYESLINKVVSNSSNLKKYCIESKIEDDSFKSKCSAYIINYEQAINKFVEDVERYNDIVKEYNKEVVENLNKLATYYTSINKVDINNDGVFQKP